MGSAVEKQRELVFRAVKETKTNCPVVMFDTYQWIKTSIPVVTNSKIIKQLVVNRGSGGRRCDALALNPYNAVSLLGHTNGTVTMWSPTMCVPPPNFTLFRV